MCTWFYADSKDLSGFVNKAKHLPLTDTIMKAMSKPSSMLGNIRPTDMAAVIAPSKNGNLGVYPMIWGFTNENFKSPLINCRIETAGIKEIWKDSWSKRRCVIPASWYYEWGVLPTKVDFYNAHEQRTIKKDRFAIQSEGSEITYLAGLYRFEEHRGVQVPMFVVLTRESVAPVSDIHDRMPLILGKENLRDLISPNGDPNSIVNKALTKLVMEKANDYQ